MASSLEECANPLLLSWVKEWWDKAREQNSKGVITYKHAYDSLKACPITFNHPSQLQQLRGFGPKLCDRLTELMKKHCQENGLPMPKRPRGAARLSLELQQQLGGSGSEESAAGPSTRRPRQPKPYVPAYRSGAYALVLALSTLGESARQGLPKPELIELAQPHCDSSFTAPSDPTKFYTAWNSMKTLLQKDLVYEKGRPLKRYSLTEEGWEVASRIKVIAEARGGLEPAGGSAAGTGGMGAVANNNNSNNSNSNNSNSNNSNSSNNQEPSTGPARRAGGFVFLDDDPEILPPGPSQLPAPAQRSEYENVVPSGPPPAPNGDVTLPAFAPIRLPPGSFTVHLVLDVREIRAKTDRDYMQEELAKKGARPLVRSLELGDALWVAKCHDAGLLARHGAEGDEVVLDWIAERKRLDDLIGSIKDGRFHEQKFRLRRSGARNVVYVVEEIAVDAATFQRHEEAVRSAIASTQVVSGFFVKRTQKMDDTVRYLARLTALLKRQYEARPLFVIPTGVLTAQNYLPLLAHLRAAEPEASYHVSYPAFASLASKSDMMTLRDVYLKMLMCTRGVTGEKALEIQRRWRTPYELVKAFERCGAAADERGGGGGGGGGEEAARKRKWELVAERTSGLYGRKKIAKALSQKIAEVWGDA